MLNSGTSPAVGGSGLSVKNHKHREHKAGNKKTRPNTTNTETLGLTCMSVMSINIVTRLKRKTIWLLLTMSVLFNFHLRTKSIFTTSKTP